MTRQPPPDGPMRLAGCVVLLTGVLVAVGALWLLSERLGL